MDLAEYKRLYGKDQNDTSFRWEAIDERVDCYHARQNPKRCGTVLSDALDGEDTQSGIDSLMDKPTTVSGIHTGQRASNPLLVTDLSRDPDSF